MTLTTDLSCLYCGHPMCDREHHADPARDDGHHAKAFVVRDLYAEASAPVALPPGVAERGGKVIGRWARRG